MSIESHFPADMGHVPQINETTEQRDARMQWFRDAKFGMFIHWGPCSVGQREIGWGRNAQRPWDIGVPDPSDDKHDAEYDNYFKVFNPVKFDADAWAEFAKESGMKYMVLITKHHDGFSMFDTDLSDYSISATPYGQDIVEQFVKAGHKHGIKVGLYYSTRDWYHPDYLVGDNKKYDDWYMGQVDELLTKYGKVDMMWYDHVGGQDWGKWRFDELYAMMYRNQPELLVNNRAARFCGPKTPEDQGPATPELQKATDGDFYTPEGTIGAMDLENDWESCIHVGQGWSYRGEDGFKGPEECIKMLVSCTTGGGNLLLNFGPRPDGTFAEGEAAVARAAGEWLKTYGDAIYGTRSGPYNNGAWGGSCHKGTKMYLHVYEWTDGAVAFDPLPRKVLAARALNGQPATFVQTADELTVRVAEADRDAPVTVVELTIDQPLEVGVLVGLPRMAGDGGSQYGELVAEVEAATLTAPAAGETPSLRIDWKRFRDVKAVVIENLPDAHQSEGLALYITDDDKTWQKLWEAEEWQQEWLVKVTHFHAGIDVPGRRLWALKLVAKDGTETPVSLKHVRVYGK